MTRLRETALAARQRISVELLAVVIALIPIAVAIARRSGGRWIPLGDNALIELRSRDVFTLRHFPLLGTWSSASLTAGTNLNHPGPLLFDLLAIPVRVFGGGTGVALGVGLINAVSVVGVAIVGHRVAGRTGALASLAIATMLCYTLGSGMLTDPWNPHVLILPFLFVVLCGWAVASGHVTLLPWMLVAGSLCLQTHLGYLYVVPTTVVVALAGAATVLRRRWRLDPTTRGGDVRRLRRTTLVSPITLVVLWVQPFGEQLFGPWKGNLARIAGSAGGDSATIGAPIGARITSSLVALPPWWSRSSFMDAVPYTRFEADGTTIVPDLPRLSIAAPALMIVLVVLLVLGVLAYRRADRPAVTMVGLSMALLGVALCSLTVMPIGPLGLTPHQMRWLWPIAAFVTGTVLLVGVRLLQRTRWVDPVLVGVVVVVAGLNVPAFVQAAGPDSFTYANAVARDLSRQVRNYRSTDPVVLDARGLRYLEQYSAVVMSALQQGGVDFRVVEAGLVRQVGNARRATGDEPIAVSIREGREALDVPAGHDRIAFTSPLSTDEIDAVLAGEQPMIDWFALNGLLVTEEGSAAIADGRYGLTVDEIYDASLDPVGFIRSGLAAVLIGDGVVELDPDVREAFTATATLVRQLGPTTVAVYTAPNDLGPGQIP